VHECGCGAISHAGPAQSHTVTQEKGGDLIECTRKCCTKAANLLPYLHRVVKQGFCSGHKKEVAELDLA